MAVSWYLPSKSQKLCSWLALEHSIHSVFDCFAQPSKTELGILLVYSLHLWHRELTGEQFTVWRLMDELLGRQKKMVSRLAFLEKT